MKVVNVKANTENLDYHKAKELAAEEAVRLQEDPMLVSWFDRRADRHYPNVSCCGCDEEPAWVLYAKNRGANLTIDVNDGEYVFIYA